MTDRQTDRQTDRKAGRLIKTATEREELMKSCGGQGNGHG